MWKRESLNILHLKLTDIALLIVFLLLMFADAIKQFIPVFSYTDELLALVLFSICVLSGAVKRLPSSDLPLVFMSAICFATGIIGNILFVIQDNTAAVAIDVLTCSKFLIVVLSLDCLGHRRYFEIKEQLLFVCKGFLVISFIFMVVNQLFAIGMSIERRYGIEAFSFFYGHPSNFAAIVVGAMAILLSSNKRFDIYCVIGIALLVGTTRFKAISFAALMLFCACVFKKRIRLSFTVVLVASALTLVVAAPQLLNYLNADQTARGVLIRSSISVAQEAFPVGSGFATFGSEVTKQYYPEMYLALGFNSVFGLTQAAPDYLADMFYPTVLAQFGFFGFLAFIFGLGLWLRNGYLKSVDAGVPFWIGMTIPIYLIIASTAEPAFFSSYAVYLAVCTSICRSLMLKPTVADSM